MLDTNTLEYHYVPTEFGDYKISIMNTNKRRELAESKYNERRSECERALAQLQNYLDVQSLGEISVAQFENMETKLMMMCFDAARNMPFQKMNVQKKAYEVLQAHDFEAFGQLLNASHASLKMIMK